MNLKNKRNEYQASLGSAFDAIPKAALAAIAISALTSGGQELLAGRDRVLREWWILYRNGIIPDKPSIPEPSPEEEL